MSMSRICGLDAGIPRFCEPCPDIFIYLAAHKMLACLKLYSFEETQDQPAMVTLGKPVPICCSCILLDVSLSHLLQWNTGEKDVTGEKDETNHAQQLVISQIFRMN